MDITKGIVGTLNTSLRKGRSKLSYNMVVHNLCKKCYTLMEPTKEPLWLVDAQVESCCMCGHITNSGIYYKAESNDPRFTCQVHKR